MWPEQQEVGVAVEEAAARREVEMAVARGGGEQVVGAHRLLQAMAAQPQQLEEIGQAAGIAHHLVDGDRQRLQLAQVLVRRIGELELALGRQQERRGDGELLAHRGDAKARLRRDRHAVLDAGQAIALADLDLAALGHGDDGARRAGLGVAGEQRVDAAFERKEGDRFRHEGQSSQRPRPCKAEALPSREHRRNATWSGDSSKSRRVWARRAASPSCASIAAMASMPSATRRCANCATSRATSRTISTRRW